MKIAYITGDISYNGNFSFYHDLLVNMPKSDPSWHHRVYLVAPTWDRALVNHLKERGVDVRACFEDFQPSTDEYWAKIAKDTSDCDVLVSGNITNLDEILPDNIKVPIVSVSIAENGYRSATGGYGSFYKPRFHKAAVSKTAVNAFPEHTRNNVKVLYTGLDPGRLEQKATRSEIRNSWFPATEETTKLLLFIGTHQESKGLKKAISCLEYLPKEWNLIVLTPPKDLDVPPHLSNRVKLCSPTYFVADIFLACDCYILPTEHEGLSMSLLEAWYLDVPVVTTKHNTMYELMARHQETDFGQLLEVGAEPEEFAKAVSIAKSSSSASNCVYQNYMASNMVEAWQRFLQGILG